MSAEVKPGEEPRREERKLGPTLRQGLRRALLEHAALKFVALVLSITLFILVNTGKDHVINAYIKVSYTMPQDRVLVSEPVDQVRITIKGPWRRIKRFDEREVDPIVIDLTGVRGNQYTFAEDAVRLPEGLELEAINPPTIPIQFEPRAEKTVPVEVEPSGRPERGYALDRTVVTPSEVTIRGAQSTIANVEAVYTHALPLASRSESFTAALSLVPPDRFVEILDTDTVEVRAVLTEEIVRRELGSAEVVVRPGTDMAAPIEDRFTVEPASVSMVAHGPLLRVEEIESVTPVVKVYTEDLARRQRRATVEIEGAPEGVGMEVTPRQVVVRPRR